MRSESFFDKVWEHTHSLPDIHLSLKGHSRGGERSCFHIPELKLYFDAGIHIFTPAKFLFITHGHTDHSGQLPTFVAGLRSNGLLPPGMYAPNESVHFFQNYLNSSFQMKRNTNFPGTYKTQGASPGDEIDLDKAGYFVRVYNLHHSVPTRGYGLCQRRKKLNSIYVGKTGAELVQLRKDGVDINVVVEYKQIAYICDTTIDGLFNNPELFDYKYIIIECTFFRDEELEIMGAHIHWSQLKPFITGHPKTHFILIHFSARYKIKEIEDFFEKEKLENITVWTN